MSLYELDNFLVHEQRVKINQENEDVHVLKIVIYGWGGINNWGRVHGGFHDHG